MSSYMKNQLELQENEWEHYEQTINDLAERLEVSESSLSAALMDKDTVSGELDDVRGQLVGRLSELRALEGELGVVQSSLADRECAVTSLRRELSEQVANHDEACRVQTGEVSRLQQVCVHDCVSVWYSCLSVVKYRNRCRALWLGAAGERIGCVISAV